MCIGEKFKRTYPFTLQPACVPCECDDSCVRRATCCPSKFYRQTPAPDFIQYPRTFDDEQGPPMHCLEPLWNMNAEVKSGKSFWMIKTCPDGAVCILPPSRNITKSTPVTSLFTMETYINIQCAFCNNEEISDLVFWEKKKLCSSRSALLSRENPDMLYKSVFEQFPLCNVGFYPPASVQSVANACLGATLDVKCENIADNRIKNYLIEACQEYYLPYYTHNNIYKNIYCAMCMFDLKDLYIQYEFHGGTYGTIDTMLTPFSALMDFKTDEKEPIANTMKCTANQIFDEKLNKCQDIVCEPEYVYQNLACEPVYPMLNENNYELNLMVVPTDSKDSINMKDCILEVSEILQDILRNNNLTAYLCRMSTLAPDSGGNFLALMIELSVNHLHSVDLMIENFLNIFSIHHEITIPPSPGAPLVHLSISVVGQSFHVHGSYLFEKYMSHRCFLNSMTGNEMVLYSKINMLDGNEHDPKYQYCTTGDMMSIVAEWYRCPKIKMRTADVRLDVSNFSVCLVDYQACFSSMYFKELPNKRGVEICLDQYLQASSLMLTKSDDKLMKYLSLSCLSLSSLGSLLTFITVTVSNTHKKLADINIMILAVFSILANTVYTFSKFFLWSELMCIGVGMLVHFSWLSVVCWMSLSTFQIFQAFTSFSNINMEVRSRVLVSLLVNCFICLTLIAINVSVSYTKSDGESFGYSPRTCYIADPNMTLFTFALPVGLVVCINTFMFVVTVSRISTKITIRKSKDQKSISSYFRLSIITGATWLFGFLAQFTELQLFSILHTIFNGGQGIFLYVAFGLSHTLKCLSCSQPLESESLGKNTSESKTAIQ
ncbi:uncharacterized protein LOC125659428 [Ostrea edulis]|uniref:uncharacterized protein LOC125659428 n=1 Tax=Ostrea edulis TaxID=37623 RepID=UPI0024AFEB55|nr:uncharacterized protein LOC125659428 [Ostrea edulis]